MRFYPIMFLASLIATYFVRLIAVRKNIIDIPNERSSHSIPTPRGGGIALVAVWFSGITYEYFFYSMNANLYFAFMAGIILVFIGLIDDIWSVKPVIRIVFQAITAIAGMYFLKGFYKIDTGFIVLENVYILTPLAFIGIIWFINLFNFLDGIDGFIGMEVVFVSLSLFVLFTDGIALLLAVVTIGFLVWNWQKAKIFMGDVGSTLMGYNIAIFAIYYQNTDKLSIFLSLILSSVFWFDATLTLFRRWRNKEKLSDAHKKHAYQRIVQAGFSHQKTTLYALLINIVLFLMAYLAIQKEILTLPILIINVFFLYGIVKLIDKKKAFK